MSDATNEIRIGSLLTLRIEGIGSRGEGLAHINREEIFTPKTTLGDEVEVRILEKKKGRYHAKLERILTPGKTRVQAKCRHFEICGGCDFQHLPYEEQISWKLRITKHWIRRSPLAPMLDKISFDTLESPEDFGYRHRARLQVKNHRLHFFKPHSNDLFEIEECPILSKGFYEALQKEASTLTDTKDWSQSFMNGSLVQGEASYELEGRRITFDEKCFTQGNLEMNALLWARIREDLPELERKQSALDLFCGIGNFSLPLSTIFAEVTGVESDLHSLSFAKRNDPKIRWLPGLSEQVLLQLEKKREFFDFVLLDPPRAGAQAAVRVLSRMMSPKITYVSCNLESLVQDLVHLVKNGGYKIRRWTVADMFPQTHHIESIVSLSK